MMYLNFNMIGSVILAAYLLLNIVHVSAIETSSMIVGYGVDGRSGVNTHGYPADLLKVKGKAALKPFQQLITKLNLSNQNACNVDTALRYISVCRSLEASTGDNGHVAHMLDSIKSIYGIRKAICETNTAKFEVPTACSTFVLGSGNGDSRNDLIQSELSLVRDKHVAACLQKFKDHHYFWTSYSNNLQEANDIERLLRAEVEQQNVIMTYRDFLATMDKFGEDIEDMHNEAKAWFSNAGFNAQELFDLQHDAFAQFKSGMSNVSTAAAQAADDVVGRFENLNHVINDLQSTVSDSISDFDKDISHIVQFVPVMKQALADVHSSAALELTSLARAQVDTINNQFAAFNQEIATMASTLDGFNSVLSTIGVGMDRLKVQVDTSLEVAIRQNDVSIMARDNLMVVTDLSVGLIESMETVHATVYTLQTFVEGWGPIMHIVERGFKILCLCGRLLLSAMGYIFISKLGTLVDGIIPHHIVVSIKATYCTLQVFIYLIFFLELDVKIEMLGRFLDTYGLQLLVWVSIFAAVAAVVSLVRHYTSNKRVLPAYDLEMSVYSSSPRPLPFKCAHDRKRCVALDRGRRAGTAPPSL